MIDLGAAGSRYELLRTVSDGPRATVFQAIDRIHQQARALKAYKVGDGSRDELLAEAQILMSIAPHAGLPVVCGDFFSDDGQYYVLVLNWVDGQGLDAALDSDGRFEIDDVLAVADRVAAALVHLHAHEPPIVHGDVKPANIIRTTAGEIVLVDFDIASAHVERGRMGTAGYVAPEVAAGEKPGPAADVYGLAATIVTLLTGAEPGASEPDLSGFDLAARDAMARVIRQGLSADPAKRPASAQRLVASLRAAAKPDHPTGVVALLATQVAGASQYWAKDHEEMEVALGRLRTVRDSVIDEFGGQVVSTTESDRTLAVFRSASSATLAALALHDRLRAAAMPSGFELELRAGLAVGETRLVGGTYTGAVVDQVLQLRAIAGRSVTFVPESTAELLLELVGREISIVPVAAPENSELPTTLSLFAIVRPGREAMAVVHTPSAKLPTLPSPVSNVTANGPTLPSPVSNVTANGPTLPSPAANVTANGPTLPSPVSNVTATQSGQPASAAVDASDDRATRRAIAADIAVHPLILGSAVAAGIALIYRVILAPELGGDRLAAVVFFVAVVATLVGAVGAYRVAVTRQQAEIVVQAQARAARDEAEGIERERMLMRQRLGEGFDGLDSIDGDKARRVLDELGGEYDELRRRIERDHESWTAGAGLRIPNLLNDTYRHGISALSDALELLESGEGPRIRRLEEEVAEIEDRLGRSTDDDAERARDEHRLKSSRQFLDRRRQTQDRARELIFQAERCTGAIAEARIELAAARVTGTEVVVDTVVHSLEDTIQRVRRIQDEVRRLER